MEFDEVRPTDTPASWPPEGAPRYTRSWALTALEVQVLAEVASGSTNREIAERLGYSIYYVKDVVAGARRRLGARDRAHASARAVSLRLIEDDGEGYFRPCRPPGDGKVR
jgi:LuxR family transcriptional regulator, transcriptional regulator of spore coat protein